MTAQSQHNSFPLASLFTGVFIAALLGCAIAWWSSPAAFHKAWLSAAMLPWSISVGSLTLMLIACLTGGRWGVAAWPWLSVSARSMPLVALIFVPWLLGAFVIYPWANSDLLAQFENTENRQWLYQMPFYHLIFLSSMKIEEYIIYQYTLLSTVLNSSQNSHHLQTFSF